MPKFACVYLSLISIYEPISQLPMSPILRGHFEGLEVINIDFSLNAG